MVLKRLPTWGRCKAPHCKTNMPRQLESADFGCQLTGYQYPPDNKAASQIRLAIRNRSLNPMLDGVASGVTFQDDRRSFPCLEQSNRPAAPSCIERGAASRGSLTGMAVSMRQTSVWRDRTELPRGSPTAAKSAASGQRSEAAARSSGLATSPAAADPARPVAPAHPANPGARPLPDVLLRMHPQPPEGVAQVPIRRQPPADDNSPSA